MEVVYSSDSWLLPMIEHHDYKVPLLFCPQRSIALAAQNPKDSARGIPDREIL